MKQQSAKDLIFLQPKSIKGGNDEPLAPSLPWFLDLLFDIILCHNKETVDDTIPPPRYRPRKLAGPKRLVADLQAISTAGSSYDLRHAITYPAVAGPIKYSPSMFSAI